MAYIGKKPEDLIRGNATYNSFTGDGSTTAFDVTNILPDGGDFDVEVFVDNVRQEAGASKSYTIGNDGNGDRKRITFNVAPDNASEIYVINPGRETSLITVADNTVSAAKIQDDAVTSAKIADGTIVSSNIAPGTIANDRLTNNDITINGTSIALGASGEIVAGTDWQAVTVADGSTTVNATAGQGYFLDTNAGVIEVFLPTSPTQGDTIILVDYAGTFATNNVIVNTGGVAIDSTVGSDFILSTNNRIAEFVYVDSNKGWLYKGATTKGSTPSQAGVPVYDSDPQYIVATGGTITTVDTDYKVHTFTGDGCFVVSSAGNPAGSDSVDYLVVAGGGGGGYSIGGGGGAGGYRTTFPSPACNAGSFPITSTTYPITVGGGGSGSTSPCVAGTSGSPSIFSTITSTSGGGGGSRTGQAGQAGGSGGGGSGDVCTGSENGGAGNTPPISPPQGNPGGTSTNSPVSDRASGGGGASSAGITNNAPTNRAGGGSGSSNSITGCSGTYAGGGGGGAGPVPTLPGGAGGPGGGGAGGGPSGAIAGTANTGGGGGGGSNTIPGNPAHIPGAAGGKGIVIIRYKFQ